MYRVAFATGSRADYGIVRNYISKLNKDPEVDFSVLTCGALLDEAFGNAVQFVEDDGFRLGHCFRVPLKLSSVADTVHIMSAVQDDYAKYFGTDAPDLLIILGDRYEMFAVAVAAAMHHIPILHIHGGEITLANYDEFIRHSITKMSRYHFTSTEEYRKRVIQLGENPTDVYYLGALGAENCLFIDEKNVPEAIRKIENCFTVLYHPETLNAQPPREQMQEVLSAIEAFCDSYNFLFIGSNADTHADQIEAAVEDFCATHKNTSKVKNLHPDAYHYLVKKSYALVGNSSSGIVEVPSLGTYTVNIGDRQAGRVRGSSIIDVPCKSDEIVKAMRYVLEHKDEKITDTPYYKQNSAELYYQATMKILHDGVYTGYKPFYDL